MLNGCRLVRVNWPTSTLSRPLLQAGLFCNLFCYLTWLKISGRKICSEIFCTKLHNSLLQPEEQPQPSFVDRNYFSRLNFSHSRISSLETDAKRLKKGKPAYFKKKTNGNLFLFCFCQQMQCYCIARAKWIVNWET